MKPEVKALLVRWHHLRQEIGQINEEINARKSEIKDLQEEMDCIPRQMGDVLFDLDEEIPGLRIGDDFVVVTGSPYIDDNNFVIQTVNFELLEEIKAS